IQVNASDLVDGIVPADQFGKGLAQFKVSFVGPSDCQKIVNASYLPPEIESQQHLKEIQGLLQDWIPDSGVQVAVSLTK
ncbi:MAG: hypothetical protein AABZ60_05870, partial [Planctomycetota bacterium]